MADFRFTPSTATTTIPYWIDDNTTTPKGFWVRVSTLTAGSNEIYMYYGDAGTIAVSSMLATGILYDDFVGTSINTNIWNADSGTWVVGVFDSKTCLNTEPTANNWHLRAKNTSFTNSSNWLIETRMYSTQAGDILCHPGLMFYASNGFNDHVYFRPHSYNIDGNIQAAYYNGSLIMADSFVGNYNWNTWHAFKFILKGDAVEVYIDNSLKGTQNGLQYDGIYQNVGIVAHDTGKTYWDYIRVRKYAPTEPTISSVSSEESAFFSTGTYKSPVIDAASKVVVSSISWNPSSQPAGTNLAVGIRVSSYPFSINSSTPSWLDVSNGQTLNWHGRYIQYQSTFTTTNSTTTPRLEDISITYRVKPWQEKSVTRTPPNSFGFGGGENWVWKIPVKGGQLVTISAYIRYNTEYLGGTYDKPKLTLSGLGINESISATSSAENSWELRQLSGTPSSDGILTLKAEGFSPNPGAKFFIDDINVSQ